MLATSVCPKCGDVLDYHEEYYDTSNGNSIIFENWECRSCGAEGYDEYVVRACYMYNKEYNDYENL